MAERDIISDIDILQNGQGESLLTKDFKAKFYKFIADHYLRKFHFFLFALLVDTSNHCLGLLNIAQPGKTRALGESPRGESEKSASGEPQASASGGQVSELERKNLKGKSFSLLRKLVRKFRRDKGHDGA